MTLGYVRQVGREFELTPRRIMTIGITIGTRFPAYATSMGRVLLAHVPEPDTVLARVELRALTPETLTDVDAIVAELGRVREQGWALVNGELETGLCSIAVPVRQPDGTVAAAVNVSTSTTRHTPDEVVRTFLPRLREYRASDRNEPPTRALEGLRIGGEHDPGHGFVSVLVPGRGVPDDPPVRGLMSAPAEPIRRGARNRGIGSARPVRESGDVLWPMVGTDRLFRRA